MNIQFTKMHGLGNDFMVIDNTKGEIILSKEQIQNLANRNFGVGFDQLLMVEKNTTSDADFNYLIYNADGSQVEQCGNGARCFARFVYENNLTAKKTITAKTINKIITLTINDDESVRVDMGVANFNPINIIYNPIIQDFHYIADIKMGLVDMGNPHAVIIVDDINLDIKNIAPRVQNSAEFINGVNVNFVQVIDENNIKLRVYERGVGETLACGSGACGSVSFLRKINKVQNKVNVELLGGIAMVEIKENIYLNGPAEFVFTGEISNI